ncbi:hypothetical protein [Clostridium chrysemydis]|uniref:hypothetical protein n=1 Tax=Clostridium chrysemydis TaxID=2665504 RepID=UPI003F2DCF4F
MKFKIERNLKIINELMSYCYHYDCKNVTVNMHTAEDNAFSNIYIEAIIYDFKEEPLEILKNSLNTQRQHEIEEYYWHLGGDSEFDSALTLVGMMVDTANVSYSDNLLRIDILRKEGV